MFMDWLVVFRGLVMFMDWLVKFLGAVALCGLVRFITIVLFNEAGCGIWLLKRPTLGISPDETA